MEVNQVSGQEVGALNDDEGIHATAQESSVEHVRERP
jgi:hypothetical protein